MDRLGLTPGSFERDGIIGALSLQDVNNIESRCLISQLSETGFGIEADMALIYLG